MVSHEGSLPTSGHYVAKTLHNGQWFDCSDQHIQAIRETDALNPSSGVYLCVYVREGTCQPFSSTTCISAVVATFDEVRSILTDVF